MAPIDGAVPRNGTAVPYADDAWLIVTDKTVEEVLPSTGSVTESVTVVTMANDAWSIATQRTRSCAPQTTTAVAGAATSVAFTEGLLRGIVDTAVRENALTPTEASVSQNDTTVSFTERLLRYVSDDLGWSRSMVKQYAALKRINDDAWQVIGTTISDSLLVQVESYVPKNGTTVPFTEGLLRDIVALTDEQQTHESPRQQLPTRAEVR
ncbi:MAG: hypothetical protein FKY71_10855 [Spiribacter salinus]|uniref:Uncharacterized protein n=1 Tax=Spiribacter salinus TaxID=1335746 RepID=A0A540VQF2_9GAMM|nr:MAG: hypothetical protein FKY71_10855 [Spiribacter salinus]